MKTVCRTTRSLADARRRLSAVLMAVPIIAATAFLGCPASRAQELGILDQYNDGPVDVGVFCHEGAADPSMAQSFIPSLPLLTGIELYLRSGGSFPSEGYSVHLRVRQGSFDGEVLAEGTSFVAGPLFAGESVWARWVFPSIQVTPGQTYVIELLQPPSPVLGWWGTSSDSYPNGHLWVCGTEVKSYDYNFRTYGADYVPPNISVSPLVADFGNVQLPGSASTLVTIQNTGGDDLVISSVALAAGASPYISIKSAPTLPLTLAANASCEVSLEFKPTALATATATLAVVSSDPDQPTVQVALNGSGVASEAPPAEQVATTLEFIEDSAAEGSLQGTGPAGAANAHLQALLNQIKTASDLAAAGKLTQACQQLANAMQRTDGDPQPPDFVTGPAAAELRLLIELTRTAIGCK